jgi:diguanylate cyclase (GGDEF)-like protein
MHRFVRGGYVPLLVATLIGLIIAAQALTLHRSYQATWLLAVRSADNVLNTVAASIGRNLSVIDLSLRGVEEAVTTSGVIELPPNIRQMVLFDRAASAQFLGSMLVLDRQGIIVYDSGSTPPRVGNFADRDYFTTHGTGSSATYVSMPFESRLRSGDPSIALSRRITGSGGQFEGVVIAALRIAFFRSLLDNVDLGPRSVIALTRADGTVILRQPSTDGKGNTGASVASSPVFQRILRGPDEPFADRSIFDRVNRYYLYKKIGDFPLYLSVGISADAAMSDWKEGALTSFALTAGMCVLLIVLIRFLRLALVRSQNMEEQLEVLAVTDQLTGLPNRRAFDLAYATEFRRARRYQTSLAVLLIDVDHFKRVNDKHGHSVGDVVLARIAKQISRSIRRPGDFAARYGGEEFIAILPATEREGAMMIAERMRAAIQSMIPSPTETDLEAVTVSIGVAVAKIDRTSSPADLINKADHALYEAKGAGRNRVVIYEQEEANSGSVV